VIWLGGGDLRPPLFLDQLNEGITSFSFFSRANWTCRVFHLIPLSIKYLLPALLNKYFVGDPIVRR